LKARWRLSGDEKSAGESGYTTTRDLTDVWRIRRYDAVDREAGATGIKPAFVTPRIEIRL
jgi:hypothetical protein